MPDTKEIIHACIAGDPSRYYYYRHRYVYVRACCTRIRHTPPPRSLFDIDPDKTSRGIYLLYNSPEWPWPLGEIAIRQLHAAENVKRITLLRACVFIRVFVWRARGVRCMWCNNNRARRHLGPIPLWTYHGQSVRPITTITYNSNNVSREKSDYSRRLGRKTFELFLLFC